MKKIISGAVIIAFTFASLQARAQIDAPSSSVSGSRGLATQVFGSDKISLDLKGMDVVEVIKMLAAKGNLNIILSNDVKGRVTIFLKSVNIMDAFEIILAANGLAYDKRGDIIYVMAQREYEAIYGEKYADRKEAKIFQMKYAKAGDVAKSLNQMKTKVGKIVVDDGSNTIVVIDSPQTLAYITEMVSKIDMPTVTKVFELKYAKAADLKAKVADILTKGVGTIQIDERTNKIAVTDLDRRMGEITDMVTAFDDKLQQVLIEAKIVQITLDDNYKLGVDWTAVIQKVGQMSKEINIASAFHLAAQNAFGPPGVQLVVGTLGTTDWGLMIQALKEIGDTNLLSSPRITALNNQEAKILVGTSQPYATNTVTQTTGLATTATNLTFIDIGVKLYVTPTINKDGFVTMKIKPEVSSSTSNYTYGAPATTVPIVTTTQAETSVTVKDGTTIIIGGLIKDQRTSTVDKIPYLGDIPIIGQVFRKTQKAVQKQELVVFLTPHIVSGEYDMLEQPKTYPINEMGFTEGEKPTFERRIEKKMDPGLFKHKKADFAEEKKDFISAANNIIIKTPEDYSYVLKSMIIENCRLPKATKGLSTKGTIRVTFLLSSKGEIKGGPDIIKSSNPILDTPAVDAVRKTAPFPVFPQSMGAGDQRFNIDISNE
ncbi:MAG: secretin N-terminal domain-containing protein [Candidatus Omnitrophota bacterium]|nr:secretin N-terminal domain-containing protein [Candidatus Omnitrophota bacterium]